MRRLIRWRLPRLRRSPVPDLIEAVVELLAGHGRSVAPVPLARRDLSQLVVFVNPERAIVEDHSSSLVRIVIRVVEAQWYDACGARTGRNGQEPIQIIVLFCGRHLRRTALAERNLADQWRVGKVCVASRIRAVRDVGQAGGGVVSKGVLEQWSAGVLGNQRRSPQKVV